MPYILVFAISIMLLSFADYCAKRGRKNYIFPVMISALLPLLLSGLRADSVGIDVSWYVVPLFNNVRNGTDFYKFIFFNNTEILYNLLVWIVAKCTKEVGVLLFFIQALSLIPVYVVLCKNRNKIPMWMGGVVYYSLVYNYSYSLMRQCIAGAFLLLATQLFLEKRKAYGVLYCFIAVLFHTPAFFIALILIVICFFKIIREKRWVQVLIILLVTFGVINIKSILGFVSSIGLIDVKYLSRIDFYAAGTGTIKTAYYIIFSIIALYSLIKSKLGRVNDYTIINIMSILALPVGLIGGSISGYLSRLMYFFYFYYIVAIPAGWNRLHGKTWVDRAILTTVFLVFFMYFWYIIFFKFNSFEVFPYVLR